MASMVGDGSLSRPYARNCHARIQWNMGNEAHARFKANAFSFVGADFKVKDNPGFGNDWFCVATKSHPLFSKFADKYGERKKNVDPASGIFHELNEVGWAWLYGDDGHYCKVQESAFIHTEGFSRDGVEIIRSALNEFMGFDCSSIHSYIGGVKKREFHCIRMSKGGSDEFIKRIKDHMADGLEYKKGRYSK
ncbi:MAG: hypothetical protein ACRC4K_14675 [Plesiomonas shigelloides]